jgi:hypothetical protein
MRIGYVAFGALIGVVVGLAVVHFDNVARNEKYSYAFGYDHANNYGTVEQCQHAAEIGTPLLSMSTLDLDSWRDGCVAAVEAWRNRPPIDMSTVGPPGSDGT